SAMRNATSESCRISLSASCDIDLRAYLVRGFRISVRGIRNARRPNTLAATDRRLRTALGGDGRCVLEVLVRRAVIATGERGAVTTGSNRAREAACADTPCPCGSSHGSGRRRRRGGPPPPAAR